MQSHQRGHYPLHMAPCPLRTGPVSCIPSLPSCQRNNQVMSKRAAWKTTNTVWLPLSNSFRCHVDKLCHSHSFYRFHTATCCRDRFTCVSRWVEFMTWRPKNCNNNNNNSQNRVMTMQWHTCGQSSSRRCRRLLRGSASHSWGSSHSRRAAHL